MTAVGPLHRLVTGLTWLMAAGIAVQAVLAGQFISGAADLRGVHLVVGSVLQLSSWVLFGTALAHAALRRTQPGLWTATVLLAVGVTVQSILGHVPVASAIAVHVPLGVGLFAWSAAVARRLTAVSAAPAPPVAVRGR